MAEIVWIANLTLKSGKKSEFLSIVRRHGGRCLELEPGCLRFEILQSMEDERRVVLVELYSDTGALEAHLSSTHLAAFREAIKEMLEDRNAFASTLESVGTSKRA